MASSGALFAVSAGIQGISSLGNAYAQSQALKAQGVYQRNLANINKNFAEMNAEDSLKRGEKGVLTVRQKVRQTVGSQRAALAAQGIDISEGSPQDVLLETQNQGALDITTIKNNAFREAWGYKVEALDATARGEMASRTSKYASKTTLLSGGMDALSFGVNGLAAYRRT